MSVQLTENAIALMIEKSTDVVNPVLQITDVKLVGRSQQGVDRYRVLLSDAIHFHQGMLATQKNHLVVDKIAKKGTIVKLTQFVVSTIQDRL